MILIENMTTWTTDYFAKPENQKKAEKACDRYDRLMVKNIRRMMTTGSEQINIADAAAQDPGKVLEKARYETLHGAVMEGKKGCIKVDLIQKTAEFIPN